jgi:EAL domain-containing protein (putative c-di-GMP-specific phosphodiesterase class I)
MLPDHRRDRHDMARLHELATQMSLYRVGLSIDDFGEGFASLARLRDLPFTELKLDRNFVQNCATDERNGNICQAAIDLGHRLGAAVIAEGIETTAAFADTAANGLRPRPGLPVFTGDRTRSIDRMGAHIQQKTNRFVH